MIVKKYNWTGKPFWDMYVADIDKDQLGKAKNFSRSINGKLHDGPASFNKAATLMAFTRNDYDTKRKDKVVELQIFFSDFKDGKWSKPYAFNLNNTEYSVGQPCLSTGGNTMYFTSDMPGGYGGSDIYRTTKDASGAWSKAENLGNKVNTEGDEMYPFYEGNNDVLFFSSNGHFGLGGLDIFVCAMNGKEFGPVVNAGYPLNTQYDDFAFIVNGKMSSGYFSSNRTGGSGGDDIYYADITKGFDIGKKIKGIAMDTLGDAIPGTFVKLLDKAGNLIDTVTTKDDGAFTFFAARDKDLKLIGDKQTYSEGDTFVNTFGKEYIVTADIILRNIKEKVVVAPVAPAAILVLSTIYFDYSKYTIRPDAVTELDKIVKIMNDNPDMIVQLSSYCDCRSSEEFNQVLSDNRAKASTDYIQARITKPERITGKGFGKTHMVNACACNDNIGSCCTEAEHQQNRRTEFVIVKK